MGSHNARGKSPIIIPTAGLQMITIQAWSALGKSQMSAYGSWKNDEGTKSYNIGALLLEYDVLALPSLGQSVFCIGDEVRTGWRELSHPKSR